MTNLVDTGVLGCTIGAADERAVLRLLSPFLSTNDEPCNLLMNFAHTLRCPESELDAKQTRVREGDVFLGQLELETELEGRRNSWIRKEENGAEDLCRRKSSHC